MALNITKESPFISTEYTDVIIALNFLSLINVYDVKDWHDIKYY